MFAEDLNLSPRFIQARRRIQVIIIVFPLEAHRELHLTLDRSAVPARLDKEIMRLVATTLRLVWRNGSRLRCVGAKLRANRSRLIPIAY